MNSARGWLWLALTAAAGWLLYLLAPVITPFAIAAAIAYLGDPLVDRLEHRGLGDWEMGRTLAEIHAPVPDLNPLLGRRIDAFLAGIKPGVSWERVNWGLSRSPERNQHPRRALPRLDATVDVGEVWLRIEEQSLVRLPVSGGVLFGIRIVQHPLSAVLKDPTATRRLVRALETMPPEVAAYKGLARSRRRLVSLLGEGG